MGAYPDGTDTLPPPIPCGWGATVCQARARRSRLQVAGVRAETGMAWRSRSTSVGEGLNRLNVEKHTSANAYRGKFAFVEQGFDCAGADAKNCRSAVLVEKKPEAGFDRFFLGNHKQTHDDL